MQIVSLLISAIALLISLLTAWLTLLREGTVQMTRPSVIYFGPDGGEMSERSPKIYLRTLLFCTAKRGRVIETMFVRLRKNEAQQNFSVWVSGSDRLERGSGLFVGENGIVSNHHFLTPIEDRSFSFRDGPYELEVFAKLVNDVNAKLLLRQELSITKVEAGEINSHGKGIYFDWAPDVGRYISHLRSAPQTTSAKETLEGLRLAHELAKITMGQKTEGDRDE